MARPTGWVLGLAYASALSDVTYRSQLVANILRTVIKTITTTLALYVVFSQVRRVVGWTGEDVLGVMGVYLILDGALDMTVRPSLAQLTRDVVRGGYEFVLLRPVNPLLHTLVRRWEITGLVNVLAGLGITSYVALHHPFLPFAVAIAQALVVVAAALVVASSLSLVLAVIVFWAPYASLEWLFDTVLPMGRFPVDIYPKPIRLLLTWAIPVAFVTTVPGALIVGRGGWGSIVSLAVVAIATFLLARLTFAYGLRQYTGTSA